MAKSILLFCLVALAAATNYQVPSPPGFEWVGLTGGCATESSAQVYAIAQSFDTNEAILYDVSVGDGVLPTTTQQLRLENVGPALSALTLSVDTSNDKLTAARIRNGNIEIYESGLPRMRQGGQNLLTDITVAPTLKIGNIPLEVTSLVKRPCDQVPPSDGYKAGDVRNDPVSGWMYYTGLYWRKAQHDEIPG